MFIPRLNNKRMKNIIITSVFTIMILLTSCVADPSSPGGKLGSKNYLGNYTMGASSGPATTYLNATGDTTINMVYSLNSGPNTNLTNIGFTAVSGGYQIYKSDIVGTLTGATTTSFNVLTWEYVSGSNTISFTGNKVE